MERHSQSPRRVPDTAPLEADRGLVRFIRERDAAALAEVVEYATAAGVYERMRGLPPATADRVASALGWELGPTRAVLQASSAGGLVDFDDELATWSLRLVGRKDRSGAARPRAAPELARALRERDSGCGVALDVPPLEALEQRVLRDTPALHGALERGATIVGFAGSDDALAWLAERYPRSTTRRFREPGSHDEVDLIVQLSPLAWPDGPERWFARAARARFVLMRTLESSLAPPEPNHRDGRGWWHALALAAAQRGGSGQAWSAPLMRRVARTAGFLSVAAHHWPADPACVHLVARHGGSASIARPR